jgi:hypothetical protein
MKEGPESLSSAPLLDQVVASLVAEMHHIQVILLAIDHNLSRGVNLRRIHLDPPWERTPPGSCWAVVSW